MLFGQAGDGIRESVASRGLGEVYKRRGLGLGLGLIVELRHMR